MFQFTQTIIRELSAFASLKLQCWLRLYIVIWSYRYCGWICSHNTDNWELPDDGLCKPKHTGATITILNDFNCLFYNNLYALFGQIKDLILLIFTAHFNSLIGILIRPHAGLSDRAV